MAITIDCTGALNLFLPTLAGSGAVVHATSGHPAFKAVTADGAATVHEIASAALTLALLNTGGLAAVMETAAGPLDLKPLSADGAAVVTETASGALEFKALTAAGTATIHEIATGALLLHALTLTGSVGVSSFPGDELGEPELAMGPYVRRESQFTILHSDRERLIVCISSAPVTITLPEAVGAFGRGFRTKILNLGAGVATLTAAAGMINESTDAITLVTTDNLELWSGGGNWYAIESNYS